MCFGLQSHPQARMTEILKKDLIREICTQGFVERQFWSGSKNKGGREWIWIKVIKPDHKKGK